MYDDKAKLLVTRPLLGQTYLHDLLLNICIGVKCTKPSLLHVRFFLALLSLNIVS